MGQRANLVVVQRGVWRLYYDHWCANSLDVELFWGPDLARAFIEQLPPKEQGTLIRPGVTGSPPLTRNCPWLLDEVWCEGGAVLDFDRRVLLFFGGEDIMRDVPYRRAYLHLLRENWPCWQVAWADEGVVSIGAYIGVAKDELIVTRDYDPQEAFRVVTEFPEDNLTLLTAVKDGASSARRVYGDAEALEQGPEGVVRVMDKIEGASSLDWEEEMPTGGLHVDFDSATLSFWWAMDAPAIEERIGAAWPGWRIEWLRDQFEKQAALSGLDVRLPERPLADLQKEALGRMRRLSAHGASNPAREMMTRLGERADINPATEEARASAGDDMEKLKLLDALAARLPVVTRPNDLHPAGTA
jgi:hypothetical protein